MSQQQEAFLKICDAIQGLTHTRSLPEFVRELYDHLQTVPLNFQALTFSRLVDAPTKTFAHHSILSDGTYTHGVSPRPAMYAIWQSKKYVYRPDITHPEHNHDLPDDFLQTTLRHWGIPTPCILNFPHAKGILTLRSIQTNAFSPEHIQFLEQVVAVLSIGISRVEDLEKVEESHQQFESLVSTIDGIFWEVDVNTFEFTYVSKQAERMLGYPVQQWQEEPQFWQNHIHPNDREWALALCKKATAENRNHEFEYRMQKLDGTYIWLHDIVSVISDNNTPIRLQGVMIDVTQRKEAELALRESEEKFHNIFLHSNEAIFVISTHDNKIKEMNPRACEMLEYGPDEWQNCHVKDFHPNDMSNVEAFISKVLVEGIGWTDQLACHTKTKRPIPTEISASKIILAGETCIIALVRDITARKLMEKEMVLVQRLNAVGELSAGISHNLNNILMGIIGPAQLLQTMTDDAECLSEIDNILKAGLQARDLVHRLHLSTRGQVETTSPVDINAAIEEAIGMARPRWKDEREAVGIFIEMDTHLQDLPTVQATHSGLVDILVNLIFNAVDAMPQGGKICIKTEAQNDNVLLTVQDTGLGMPEEISARIFEPFFTTKANVGTGLGLSTVHTTIQNWQGQIEVTSVPEKGTTFHILLPILAQSEKAPRQKETPPSQKMGNILVIDDEKMITNTITAMLKGKHNVEVEHNAKNVLQNFEPNTYDIALIDLGLPHMPGNEVATHLKQKDPHLITILITGWELSEDDPQRRPFDDMLLKPFEMPKLLSSIEKAMNARSSSKT